MEWHIEQLTPLSELSSVNTTRHQLQAASLIELCGLEGSLDANAKGFSKVQSKRVTYSMSGRRGVTDGESVMMS